MTALLAVVGPTASGKTSLAIELAQRLDTEIVSADSMQFYKGMEIGTAAPTPAELARVKHHFVGFLEPSEEFSAGAFQAVAREVVAALNDRGKTAVAAGGSGLYVRALIDGLFAGPGRDEAIRQRLRAEAETAGTPALFERLKSVDAPYAAAIGPSDLRRIVRALEVYELTGTPLSVLHRKHRAHSEPLDAVQVAIGHPREVLYARIDTRVDRMLREGLLGEVRALLDKGLGPHIDRLRSLGYREMARHLQGECSLEEASECMKMNTRRFAKRQLSWLRADPRIHWLPAEEDKPVEAYAAEATALLARAADNQAPARR